MYRDDIGFRVKSLNSLKELQGGFLNKGDTRSLDCSSNDIDKKTCKRKLRGGVGLEGVCGRRNYSLVLGQ